MFSLVFIEYMKIELNAVAAAAANNYAFVYIRIHECNCYGLNSATPSNSFSSRTDTEAHAANICGTTTLNRDENGDVVFAFWAFSVFSL